MRLLTGSGPLLLAAFVAILPGVLQGQPAGTPRWTLTVPGPSVNTPVTGVGNTIETLRGPANTVLTRMEFFERSDRPCQVRATFAGWEFDAQDRVHEVSETVRTFDGCNGNAGSRQTIQLDAPNAAWAVRACVRRQNDRLKGLEVKGATIRRDGVQFGGVSHGVTSWERPNCNEWSDFVECGGGRVARGLRIAHETDPVVITGLSLECADPDAATPLSAGTGRGVGGRGSLTGTGMNAGSGSSGPTTYGWTSPSWTSVSGETAPNSDIIDAPSPYAIKGILVVETGDRPWVVGAALETLCNGICPDGPDDTENRIRSDPEFDLMGLGGLEQSLDLSLDDDHYVTALQVCTSGQNNPDNRRIKGLRIWGARLGSQGQLVGSSEMHEERRTNCSQWYPRLECPVGQVAVGLRGYFDSRRSDPFFTGLAMRCGRVG